MTRDQLLFHMERLGACKNAKAWVRAQVSDDAEEIWSTCERSDWLMWLVGHAGVSTWLIRDVAVRVIAPFALEAAGLCDEAAKLRALPEIVDRWTADGAARVARAVAADVAANAAADARAAAYAAYATYDAAAAAADADAAYAAAYAADAHDAALAAHNAADDVLSERIRERIGWSTVSAALGVCTDNDHLACGAGASV